MIRTATLSTVCAIAMATGVYADCGTRHLYNNSDGVMYLSMHGGTCDGWWKQAQIIYQVHDAHDCLAFPYTAGNPRLGIPAGPGVIDIHYKNGGTLTSIDVWGAWYNRYSFDIDPIGERCVILHSDRGNTGNIVVNGPTEGDISTCGVGTYACNMGGR